jgi:hypothetical protein
MDKALDKSKWQSMTASAKKILRSNGGKEIPKSDTIPLPVPVAPRPNNANSDSGPPETLPVGDQDVVSLHPENLALSSVSDTSLGSRLPIIQVKLGEAANKSYPTNSFTPSVGDRSRTMMRYVAAVEELRAALRLRRPGWETFDFPDFDKMPESVGNIALLQKAIDEKLGSCHDLGDKGIWQKGKLLAERLFVALSPFAKTVLTVAKDASPSVTY